MTISDSKALTQEKENMFLCAFLKQFLVSNGNLFVSEEFAAVYFHCDLYLCCFIFFLIITEYVLCVLLILICICLFAIVSTLKYRKKLEERKIIFSLSTFHTKTFLFLQLHNRYIWVHFALEWGTWDKNTGCAEGTHTGVHGGKTFATVCHDL